VFKAHRLLYHSTLVSRVIKKKKNPQPPFECIHGGRVVIGKCVNDGLHDGGGVRVCRARQRLTCLRGYLAHTKAPPPHRNSVGPLGVHHSKETASH